MKSISFEGYRLSPQQRRLWAIQQDNPAYRAQCAIMLEGAIHTGLLKEAVVEVFNRHEILRTNFRQIPAMNFPVQVVLAETHLSFRNIDLSEWPPAKKQPRLDQLIGEDRLRPFDFEKGVLVRLSLVALQEKRHILIITLPSLCADARTLKNLVLEISRSYAALSLGEKLDDRPMQYADYAEWHNELLREGNKEAIEFWQASFRSSPGPLTLPLELRPQGRKQTAPKSVSFQINFDLVERIQSVARKHETETSVFLLACWQILLWRLTGEKDIEVGVLFDGRRYEELQSAMGPFALWLPVAGHFDKGMKYSEVLKQVGQARLEAYSWQEYFNRDECEKRAKDGPASCCFPVGFEYEERPARFSAADATFSIYRQYACIENFKINLRCASEGDSLTAEIQFDPNLFQVGYIDHIKRCLITLLSRAANDTDAAISDLGVLDDTDLNRLLVAFNDTEADYPDDRCIHNLFEQQVERSAEAVAVMCEGDRLIFGELNAAANQLAHHLRKRGVTAGTLVGIYLDRSAEAIIALLGVLKAGGAYVPLDPEIPRERVARQIEDLKSRLLITQQTLLTQLPDFEGEALCLDRDNGLLEDESKLNPSILAAPDDPAYVIYTSGSSGAPKGVVITHRSLVNYAHFICGDLQLRRSPESPPLQFATVSTLAADLGNTVIFPSILTGGCLHVLSYRVATDGIRFADYLAAHPIDVLKIVPSHLNAMLAAQNGKNILPRRCLILGGEALSFDLLDRIATLKPVCDVINHYGPTETTIGVLTFRVEDIAEYRAMASTVPIGRPIANTQAYILDQDLKPVPIGVPGELYIGGVALARGYLNNPDLTAERFIDAPPSTGRTGRLYSTGDIARFLSDGNIEFLGRADNQVKVRGYRIELGEVEVSLREHPSVRDAVVVAREDSPGDKRLVAYVVAEKDRDPSVNRHSMIRLPNNMVIAHKNRHETEFFYDQIFVRQTDLKYGIRLDDDACVFDVGANIGLFTLLAHQQCRDATIFAFEPSPPIFELLRRNTELYGVNARLFDFGLSNREKTVPFTFYPNESCMSSYYADRDQEKAMLRSILKNQRKGGPATLTNSTRDLERLIDERIHSQTFECHFKTLSDVISEYRVERIDLLKIDVEKSEYDVLEGIRGDDWKKIKQIVIEAHDIDGRLEKIRGLLEMQGYSVVVEQDAQLERTGLFNIYSIRRSAQGNVSAGERKEPFERPLPALGIGELSGEELRNFLESKLPSYMLPSAFVMLDSLPLTQNGKVDRSALPAPDQARPELKAQYVTPRNRTEKLLAAIWSQVLEIADIGIDDNFFVLGGDSIRSIQVRYRAQEMGLNFETQEFFEHPTIRELARIANFGKSQPASESRTGPFSLLTQADRVGLPSDVVDAYPLAMLQAGMIYHSQYSDDSTSYHDIIGYHLRCRFDFQAMVVAVQQLVNRHPVLRTAVSMSGYSEPLQLVYKLAHLPIDVVDLRSLAPEERESHIESWMEGEKSRKFDLSRPPLMRVTVHLLTEETFQLTLNHHHIIIDGWSNASMTTELLQRYLALLDKTFYPERSLETSFRDFVALEREALQSKECREFWTEKLSDSTIMKLPRWSPSGKDVHERLRVLNVPISLDLSERLKAIAQTLEVPLKSVLLAGHLKVMGLLAGQSDILTGVVTHGRPDTKDSERVLGLFLNSLPHRQRLSGGTWIDLIKETYRLDQESRAYRRFPLAELQRELGGESLFETLFSFSHFHVFEDLIGVENFECLGVRSFQETNFTLVANFTMDLIPLKIRLDLEYDSIALCPEQIQAISSYYLATLEEIASRPSARYEKWSALSASERLRLIAEFNQTRRDYKLDRSVHEMFEAQAENTPEEFAVVFEQERLTYRELNIRANQLARYLQRLGAGPDVVVGICMERALEMTIAVLGVLKAGAAYVVLDPSYPRPRLALMIGDAGARILLTQERLTEDLLDHNAQVLCLDTAWDALAEESGDNPASAITPDSLAYIIYTSGSTGRPKGTALTHRMLTNLIEWHRSTLSSGARTLQFSSMSFDASLQEIFSAWCSGGRLLVLSEETRMDVSALADFIVENRVEKMILPVVVLQQLAEDCHSKGLIPESLKEVITCGEQLQITKPIISLFEQMKDCTLHNHYGPSETHAATAYTLTGPPSSWAALPSIGSPISNVQVYLLDEWMQVVPTGVPGELYIGGVGLARGYVNGPKITAEKFIPDPFSDEPGARLYKTGDLARYQSDGNIDFIGRIDHQVKLRGYRIEPGEIEAVLTEHPDIREAVVLAQGRESGEKRLVGYVVPDPLRAPVVNGHKRIPLPNGMAIAYVNKNEVDAIYEEIFQDLAHTLYGITIEEGDCIFDVGANIGLFTLFASTHCDDISIYAFEPNPVVCELLRVNSNLYGTNVKVYECGLSNQDKTAEFTYYPRASVWSGFYADPLEDENYFRTAVMNQQVAEAIEHMDELMDGRFEGQLFTCKLRRLSDVIRENNVERIDLLKIDVERAEMDVLEGIDDEHWKNIRQVVIEVHDIHGRLENVCMLLASRGYELFVDQERLLKHTDMYHVYAMRSPDTIGSNGKKSHFNRRPSVKYKPLMTVEELRGYLKERLPDYMVPSAFVMLEEIPLTRNGKVDRGALPVPDQNRPDLEGAYVAPRNPIEEVLAGIWADLLGLTRVGVYDNFFELGGHSLKGTQIMSRVRDSFHVEIPVRKLFDTLTVSGLAGCIKEARQEGLALPPPICRVERAGQVPLSFAQQRLWFLSRLKTDTPFYNTPAAARFTGRLNVDALESSLSEITCRHEVLRTTFAVVDGYPVQVIAEPQPLRLPIIDLRAVPLEEREAVASRLVFEEARVPFDLERGPVLRATLLKLAEQEHILLLTMHHIVSDNWSMGVFISEAVALYKAFSQGETSPLADLDIQYADFAIWQREWMQEESLGAQLNYWKQQMAGAPEVVELPLDRPRQAVQAFKGASEPINLPTSLSGALRALSRREGVTLFMTLLAAFKSLLFRYAGQTDIIVGTPIANRRWAEIEGLIGFFANALALRTNLSGNPTFRELLARVREVTLDAYANQDLPFEKLVEELQPERKLSHTPLFQVVFTLQNAPMPPARLPDLVISPVEVESGTSMFDLILGMIDSEDELTGLLVYNSDLFDSATIKQMVEHFKSLLENIVGFPECRLLDISLERSQQEQKFSGSSVVQTNYGVEQFDFQAPVNDLPKNGA